MKTIYRILFGVFPFLLAVISLFLGRYQVQPKEVLLTFAQLFTHNGMDVGLQSATVVLQLRLPRIIAAAFVGAGLAASGAAFQGVFHNPLVSPGLLGVTSGAGFGAALAIILFTASWVTYPFAFVFGLIAVAASYWVARIYKTVPTVMLVLGGTIITSIFSALVSLLKYAADTERQLPAIVYWLMGSLSSVAYKDFWALLPIMMGLLILFAFGWKVNVLSMGDKEAQTMGVDVRQTKTIVIVGATLATAGAVCLAGAVGWIGLVIPHISRMVAGNDNRTQLPLSISLGAAFMILIDTLSRTIIESEIPLGILTSLVGAPFFIYLIKKTKGGGWRQ